MRKIIGWVLLGLGAFLLVTALLAALWAPAQLERTPLDTDTKTYLGGTAEKLNPALGETEMLDVKATSNTQADADSSDDDVIVFVNTTCLVIDEGDVPDCVEADEPLERLITASSDVFATDRHTAMAVNGKYRHPGAEEKEGLINKFPFNAEKKDYPFWDGILGAVATAEFEDTEIIDGLETYKYHVLIEDEPVDDITAGLPGIYSQDKYIWIEPRTGSIVKQTQHEVRTLEDGDLLLDLNLAFTEDQVAKNIEESGDNKSQLDLVTQTVPLVAGILGLLAILGGGFIVFSGRRDQKA